MRTLDEYEDAFFAYMKAYDAHQSSICSFLPQSWTASGRRLRAALRRFEQARQVERAQRVVGVTMTRVQP